ncbi:MAG: hypothetical protein FWE80_08545 [Oscillospiraceae bacterium]|nr:hypothetical protein [Oscillospiraceae bacterium]
MTELSAAAGTPQAEAPPRRVWQKALAAAASVAMVLGVLAGLLLLPMSGGGDEPDNSSGQPLESDIIFLESPRGDSHIRYATDTAAYVVEENTTVPKALHYYTRNGLQWTFPVSKQSQLLSFFPLANGGCAIGSINQYWNGENHLFIGIDQHGQEIWRESLSCRIVQGPSDPVFPDEADGLYVFGLYEDSVKDIRLIRLNTNGIAEDSRLTLPELSFDSYGENSFRYSTLDNAGGFYTLIQTAAYIQDGIFDSDWDGSCTPVILHVDADRNVSTYELPFESDGRNFHPDIFKTTSEGNLIFTPQIVVNMQPATFMEFDKNCRIVRQKEIPLMDHPRTVGQQGDEFVLHVSVPPPDSDDGIIYIDLDHPYKYVRINANWDAVFESETYKFDHMGMGEVVFDNGYLFFEQQGNDMKIKRFDKNMNLTEEKTVENWGEHYGFATSPNGTIWRLKNQ